MNKKILNLVLLSMLCVTYIKAADTPPAPPAPPAPKLNSSVPATNTADRGALLSQIQGFKGGLKKINQDNKSASDSSASTHGGASDEVKPSASTNTGGQAKKSEPTRAAPRASQKPLAGMVPFDPKSVKLKRSESISSRFDQDVRSAGQSSSLGDQSVSVTVRPSNSDVWPFRSNKYDWKNLGRHEALKDYNEISDENAQREYLELYGQKKGAEALKKFNQDIEIDKKRKEKSVSSTSSMQTGQPVVKAMLTPPKDLLEHRRMRSAQQLGEKEAAENYNSSKFYEEVRNLKPQTNTEKFDLYLQSIEKALEQSHSQGDQINLQVKENLLRLIDGQGGNSGNASNLDYSYVGSFEQYIKLLSLYKKIAKILDAETIKNQYAQVMRNIGEKQVDKYSIRFVYYVLTRFYNQRASVTPLTFDDLYGVEKPHWDYKADKWLESEMVRFIEDKAMKALSD